MSIVDPVCSDCKQHPTCRIAADAEKWRVLETILPEVTDLIRDMVELGVTATEDMPH